MSRIAKAPVDLPKGVTATVSPESVTIKGAKGTLSVPLTRGVSVVQTDSKLEIKYTDPGLSRTQAGSIRAHLANMVAGVTKGYERKLELVGVGFRAQVTGKSLNLTLASRIRSPPDSGRHHHGDAEPDGIVIKGIDRQKVVRSPPKSGTSAPRAYKGKGVKYAGEKIPSKRGKRNDYYEEAAAHAPRYQDAGAHSSAGA